MTEQQLTLFSEEDIPRTPKPKKRNGGSQNSIVFHDYESFLEKFADNPKTTDECYTPPDVYEAVVKYVGTAADLTNKQILRPFFPGGDYENADYPDDGIVIDNPPFSIFTKCCAFYAARKIPFFLFGPGMTITNCLKYCTAVFISRTMIFENGAKVRVNFGSNLFGDTMVMTAPLLDRLIADCPSQNKKVNLPKFRYPSELLSVSQMMTIAGGGVEFKVMRSECEIMIKIDNHPKSGGLFGSHLLTTTAKARAKEAALERAKEAAQKAIPIELSPRERAIIERLDKANSHDDD